MKMKQAKLEETKNENIEAVKRLCALAITLAKLGFTLLKKIPWAKIDKAAIALLVPVGLFLAAVVQFLTPLLQRFGDAALDAMADHDFKAEVPEDSDVGGMWMNADGSISNHDTGGMKIS